MRHNHHRTVYRWLRRYYHAAFEAALSDDTKRLRYGVVGGRSVAFVNDARTDRLYVAMGRACGRAKRP